MGSSSQDLADALLIIFKTNLSVTDSKVSKGFPAKEVLGQAAGFGGEIFSDCADFLSEVIRKKTFGRSSELNVEGKGEDLLLPKMVIEVLKELFTGCTRLNLSIVSPPVDAPVSAHRTAPQCC